MANHMHTEVDVRLVRIARAEFTFDVIHKTRPARLMQSHREQPLVNGCIGLTSWQCGTFAEPIQRLLLAWSCALPPGIAALVRVAVH